MRLSYLAIPFFIGCAKAITLITDDDGGLDGSSSECPGFNLQTDSKHCGSCTKACALDEVCGAGVCKKACDPPTVKCGSAEAGTVCADLTTDTLNCGKCNKACPIADGGGVPPGTQNPDPGIDFDGGYDAGPGWITGTASCDKSVCGTTCAAPFTLCTDGLCYDTMNHHEHCGDCNTACIVDDEWCSAGHCCAVGQMYCGTACSDVLSDPSNCGGCGITCSGSTPYCGSGKCTAGVIYSETFPTGTVSSSSSQCTNWNSFRAKLTGTYTTITIKGSNDSVGVSCTGSVANTMCQALKNGTTTTATTCNGRQWKTGTCTGMEVSADGYTCSCTPSSNGYTVRPCINNNNWGGVKSAVCGATGQTMTVVCQ